MAIASNQKRFPIAKIAVVEVLITYTFNDVVEIEKEKNPETAGMLLPLLKSENWLLKAKTLITLGRLQNPETAVALIDFLQQEKEPYWQLMALDSWHTLPLSQQQKASTLQELLVWANSPILVRGIISLSAYIGGETLLMMLADFINQPSHRLVKDEVLAFAWFRVAKNLTPAFLEQQLMQRELLAVWLRHQREDEKAVYGIYPTPDYLWQCAQKAGVAREAFKKLYQRPRKKQVGSYKHNSAESVGNI